MHTDVSPTTEPGTAVRYLSRTSEVPTDGPGARPARVDTVDTPEEFATIGHMRGWCHDTSKCEICKYADRSYERGLEITKLQTDNAHLARELMLANNTVESIISG